MSLIRTRWAAIGAAVAVALGAGGLVFVDAAQDSGERSVYNPITPCRLVDTRPNHGIGGKTSPLGPGETLAISTHGTSGQCTGTPTDITAVQLNITPVLPTAATDLTVWPSGDAPNASSLNPAPGQPPTPNAVTSEVTGAGEFNIRNKFGSVHVIVDLVGFYRDHNHDDRYYTKSQTNNQIATAIADQPWSVHIAPSDFARPHFGANWPATWTDSAIGLAFDDGTFDRVFTGFQLPPNYTSGTDVRMNMHWLPIDGFGTHVFPCNAVFSMVSYATRAGASVIFAPVTWENPWEAINKTRLGATASLLADKQISETYVTIDGTDLRPGDMVNFALIRIGDESADTCQGIMVTGLEAFES